MVERTHTNFTDESEGKRVYSYWDKKPDCDFCKGLILETRVMKARGGNFEPYAVFCSYKCSRDWSRQNSNASD